MELCAKIPSKNLNALIPSCTMDYPRFHQQPTEIRFVRLSAFWLAFLRIVFGTSLWTKPILRNNFVRQLVFRLRVAGGVGPPAYNTKRDRAESFAGRLCFRADRLPQ